MRKLIAEFARRHRERDDRWGRIVTLTSGGPDGFPGEASYGAAKALPASWPRRTVLRRVVEG